MSQHMECQDELDSLRSFSPTKLLMAQLNDISEPWKEVRTSHGRDIAHTYYLGHFELDKLVIFQEISLSEHKKITEWIIHLGMIPHDVADTFDSELKAQYREMLFRFEKSKYSAVQKALEKSMDLYHYYGARLNPDGLFSDRIREGVVRRGYSEFRGIEGHLVFCKEEAKYWLTDKMFEDHMQHILNLAEQGKEKETIAKLFALTDSGLELFDQTVQTQLSQLGATAIALELEYDGCFIITDVRKDYLNPGQRVRFVPSCVPNENSWAPEAKLVDYSIFIQP
ncbi:MAG: hypothetical protein ABIJ34_05480 [archaeon]